MKYLCRTCGREVTKVNYETGYAYCPYCDLDVIVKEAIANHTFKARMNQLKAMHELMLNVNDEDIYMSWINLMPDEPSEEDFKDMALDDEQYNECFDLFIELIADEGNRW